MRIYRESVEGFSQSFDRLDVQMIGRFIENEEIWSVREKYKEHMMCNFSGLYVSYQEISYAY